jgi:hypothetical protein
MVVLLIPVAQRWGINGVSWLSAIVAVVDFIISAWLINKLIDAPWRAYVRMLAPTWAVALASGFVTLWLYDRLPFAKAAWNLLLAGVILVALYAALAWLADREFRATTSKVAGQVIRLVQRRSATVAPRP